MTEAQFDLAVGTSIQRFRKDRHFSQAEIASKLGLSRSSIANIENGFHKPSVFQLYKFCGIVGIEFEELLPAVTTTKERNINQTVLPADIEQKLAAKLTRKNND